MSPWRPPPRRRPPQTRTERRDRDGQPRDLGDADPDLYFNRELSWLDFNDRVLQLAEDESMPLIER